MPNPRPSGQGLGEALLEHQRLRKLDLDLLRRHEIPKRFGYDFDNTVADTQLAVIRLAREMYGLTIDPRRKERLRSQFIARDRLLTLEQYKAIKDRICRDPTVATRVPLSPHVYEVFCYHREMGQKVVIITSRDRGVPTQQVEALVRHYGLPVEEVIPVGRGKTSKEEAARWLVGMVDDTVGALNSLRRVVPHLWLYNPSNSRELAANWKGAQIQSLLEVPVQFEQRKEERRALRQTPDPPPLRLVSGG